MKKVYYTLFLTLFLFISNVAILQKGTKTSDVNPDPLDALKQELLDYKKASRTALKPYRYDGMKTTYFTYKSFDYIDEVELATIQKTEYRLSFNAKGIHEDKIKIRIYDKPKESKGRILLYEKDDVGGNDFTCETTEMLEKLKAAKQEKGVSEDIIKVMQLKKLYVDYIIPAVDREVIEEKEKPKLGIVIGEANNHKVDYVIKRGAIIVSVGYQNLPIE